jgi:hypothetical protein
MTSLSKQQIQRRVLDAVERHSPETASAAELAAELGLSRIQVQAALYLLSLAYPGSKPKVQRVGSNRGARWRAIPQGARLPRWTRYLPAHCRPVQA